jgi:hypothetical protein
MTNEHIAARLREIKRLADDDTTPTQERVEEIGLVAFLALRELEAPEPTDEERVAEHMQLVEIAANVYHSEWPQCPKLDAVEQSARALLAAGCGACGGVPLDQRR